MRSSRPERLPRFEARDEVARLDRRSFARLGPDRKGRRCSSTRKNVGTAGPGIAASSASPVRRPSQRLVELDRSRLLRDAAAKKVFYLGCDQSNPFCAAYNKTMESALKNAGYSVARSTTSSIPSTQAQQMSQATRPEAGRDRRLRRRLDRDRPVARPRQRRRRSPSIVVGTAVADVGAGVHHADEPPELQGARHVRGAEPRRGHEEAGPDEGQRHRAHRHELPDRRAAADGRASRPTSPSTRSSSSSRSRTRTGTAIKSASLARRSSPSTRPRAASRASTAWPTTWRPAPSRPRRARA